MSTHKDDNSYFTVCMNRVVYVYWKRKIISDDLLIGACRRVNKHMKIAVLYFELF